MLAVVQQNKNAVTTQLAQENNMQKLLQLALITGSLLTGKLFATTEDKAPKAASAAIIQREHRELLNFFSASDFTAITELEARHPGIIQTKFTGFMDTRINHGVLQLRLTDRDAPAGPSILRHRAAHTPLIQLNGCTILHIAAMINGVDMAIWLLKNHYLDPNTTDTDGITALHQAVHHNRIDVIKILLEYGANVDATMPSGATAFSMATEDAHLEIIDLLTFAGATQAFKHRNLRTFPIITALLSQLPTTREQYELLEQFIVNPIACMRTASIPGTTADILEKLCCYVLYISFRAQSFQPEVAHAILDACPQFAFSFYLDNRHFGEPNRGLLRLAKLSDEHFGFTDTMGPRESLLRAYVAPGKAAMARLMPSRGKSRPRPSAPVSVPDLEQIEATKRVRNDGAGAGEEPSTRRRRTGE